MEITSEKMVCLMFLCQVSVVRVDNELRALEKQNKIPVSFFGDCGFVISGGLNI